MILPDKFSCLVEALESTNDSCAGAFGNASFIDEHGRQIYLDAEGKPQQVNSDKTYTNFLEFYTRDTKFDYKTEFGTYRTLILAGCSYLPAMSNLLKTAIVKEVGGWTVGNVLEDWEMWLKLSKQHKFLYIDRTIAVYRRHGRNMLETMKQKVLHDNLMLLEREREYCDQNGLTRAWRDFFYGLLYWVVRYGDAPIEEKLRELHNLKPSDVFPLIGFLAKARYKTLSRKFSEMRARILLTK
jgi:hypothetical protein